MFLHFITYHFPVSEHAVNTAVLLVPYFSYQRNCFYIFPSCQKLILYHIDHVMFFLSMHAVYLKPFKIQTCSSISSILLMNSFDFPICLLTYGLFVFISLSMLYAIYLGIWVTFQYHKISKKKRINGKHFHKHTTFIYLILVNRIFQHLLLIADYFDSCLLLKADYFTSYLLLIAYYINIYLLLAVNFSSSIYCR